MFNIGRARLLVDVSRPGCGSNTVVRTLTSDGKTLDHEGEKESVYELRTYTVYAHKVREFLALTTEKFHLRTGHSRLLGYWTAELGGLNQTVHLWQYNSLAHRASVRARLAADQQWVSQYVNKVAPMWQHQDNALLVALPGNQMALEPPRYSQPGLYELQTVFLKGLPGSWCGVLADYVRGANNQGVANGTTGVVGAWRSILGPVNMGVILLRHQHPDACFLHRNVMEASSEGQALYELVQQGHSKLLVPHAVSPLK